MDWNEFLKLDLIGKEISFQDLSDDGHQLKADITEINLVGNLLKITTTEAVIMWWSSESELHGARDFSCDIEFVEKLITNNRMIIISPWNSYDQVIISLL